MTEDQYRGLFQDLGILADERMGYVLCFRGQSMRLYFNELKRSIGVHFIAYLDDEHLYPTHLWVRIDPNCVKRKDRPECGMIPIVPRPGFERGAFEELLDS